MNKAYGEGGTEMPIGRLAATVEQLESILRQFGLQGRSYYFRRKVNDVKLGEGTSDLVNGGLWDAGRLFNETFEVRWQKMSPGYEVTVLTEAEQLPSLPDGLDYEEIDADWLVGETAEILLWGSYKQFGDAISGFVEARIPKILDYPAPNSGRWMTDNEAVIVGVNYVKNGIVQFTRFKEVRKRV
jgi:hypothetical protein